MFIPAFAASSNTLTITGSITYTLIVSENANLRQTIGSITAFDQDTGQAGDITFSIVGDGSER